MPQFNDVDSDNVFSRMASGQPSTTRFAYAGASVHLNVGVHGKDVGLRVSLRERERPDDHHLHSDASNSSNQRRIQSLTG